MDEVYKNLNSIGWWVSVVAVGVLVNFLSQFLFPRLAAVPSKTFDAARRAVREQEAEIDRRTQALVEHPERLPLYIAMEARMYWLASFLFGSTIALLLWVVVFTGLEPTLMTWVRPVVLCSAAVTTFFGMAAAQSGFKFGRIVVRAMH